MSSTAGPWFSRIQPERQGDGSETGPAGEQMDRVTAGGLSTLPASQGHTMLPVGCQMQLRWTLGYVSFILRVPLPSDIHTGESIALRFLWLKRHFPKSVEGSQV